MTKKKSKTVDRAAVESLRARLLATVEFIESMNDFPSGVAFRTAIEKAATDHDLRTLRLLGREVDLVATVALPPHQRDGLDAKLRQGLGVDREAERAALSERVAVALKRGSIASEVERRHLEDYAEMLEAGGDTGAELDAIRRLLQAS